MPNAQPPLYGFYTMSDNQLIIFKDRTINFDNIMSGNMHIEDSQLKLLSDHTYELEASLHIDINTKNTRCHDNVVDVIMMYQFYDVTNDRYFGVTGSLGDKTLMYMPAKAIVSPTKDTIVELKVTYIMDCVLVSSTMSFMSVKELTVPDRITPSVPPKPQECKSPAPTRGYTPYEPSSSDFMQDTANLSNSLINIPNIINSSL